MPGARPCQIHAADGEHEQSDWLMTAQDERSGFPPGETFYVCIACLSGLVVSQYLTESSEGDEEPTEEAWAAQELPEPVEPVAVESDRQEPAQDDEEPRGRFGGAEDDRTAEELAELEAEYNATGAT